MKAPSQRIRNMLSKKDYKLGAGLVYLVLIAICLTSTFLFPTNHVKCSNNNCVRFCCIDQEKCSENFVKENFMQSLIPGNQSDLKFFYGKPNCYVSKLGSGYEWKFVNVSEDVWLKERPKNQFLWIARLCQLQWWARWRKSVLFRCHRLLSRKSN